ncbi:MAG: glycosyltransferase family 4 protein [Candidatus Jacksonbacteria bacterium]
MKILIVSLLKRNITPEQTASRPRVIYDLASGLLKRGHKVSILGTGDSNVPGAKIIPVISKSWINRPPAENEFYAQTADLISLAKRLEQVSSDYDIIHNHTYPEFINLMIADRIKTAMVTTLHAQATAEFDRALSMFPQAHLVSISKAHKRLFKIAKIAQVIYNGIDTDLYSFCGKKQDYMLWIGRLGKAKNKDGIFQDAKGVRWAIKLAQATGQKLKMAGNVEDMEFFERDVKPHLNDKIQWIGGVLAEYTLSKKQVVKLMQKARVFLMTISWYEPFGLVMAEAMSCGAPVIAFNRGSVPELVIDGKTGFVVEYKQGVQGLIKALSKINQIDPRACRKHVEENFSLDKMVRNYEKVYQLCLKNN